MRPIKQKVGDIYSTSDGEVTVLAVENCHKILVEFKNTGYKTYCRSSSLVVGSVKDYFKPLDIAGYLGGKKYSWSKNKKPYQAWRNMLRRCYDVNSDRYGTYGARGVTVSSDWLNFQNFAEWWVKEEFRVPEELRGDLQIDKDFQGDVYDRNSCKLIPSDLNLFLSGNTKGNKVSYWCEGSSYRVKEMLPSGEEGRTFTFYSLKDVEIFWVEYRARRAGYLIDKYKHVPYLLPTLRLVVELPIFKRPRYDKDVADTLSEIKDKVRIK